MRPEQIGLFLQSVRYTRLGQLYHRLRLKLKRLLLSKFSPTRYAGRVGLRASSEDCKASSVPPAPVFQARVGMVKKEGGSYAFRFLNEQAEFPGAIHWHPDEYKKGTRLWLLNLHYMEFLEELDDGEFVEAVKSWIVSNKPYKEGYWLDDWNSYALSIRVVVWMQQLSVRNFSADNEFVELAQRSLYSQLLFLESNLELDIGGNHLLKNIKALLWAGRYFTGSAAKRWRRKGEKFLRQEMRDQFTSEGMHFELSPAYHCQVFADLLECLTVLQAGELRVELESLLQKAAEIICDTTHPDGLTSLFNDGGLHMAYRPDELLSAYNTITGKAPRASAFIQLHDAGYFGFRKDDEFFLFDCGELAPDFLPAHGHGDALAFEWSVNGERLVIDPGVYEYNPGEFRDISRATSSHNTVTLDGMDQSEFWSAFRVARRARIQRKQVEVSGEEIHISGEHTGYQRLAGAPVHRRDVSARPGLIKIDDKVSGGNGQRAESRLMFSPQSKVQLTNGAIFVEAGSTQIQITTSGECTVEEAWCFLDFGCRTRTRQLVIDYGECPVEGWLRMEVVKPGSSVSS